MLDSWTLCAVLALASAVLFVAYLATTFVRYGYIVSPQRLCARTWRSH